MVELPEENGIRELVASRVAVVVASETDVVDTVAVDDSVAARDTAAVFDTIAHVAVASFDAVVLALEMRTDSYEIGFAYIA
ncbi:hypothetical protein HDU79_011809 [Rhizoclosmatium sp. JEL0117]|nr:hypothetical protein HDU79_011809 [Rhizoclosmatium sp. JEL0117]